jgi:succinyl-CoA synthetase beta subunit
MKIHEYQAKELLASYGVNVPEGIPAVNADQAYEAAKKFGACVIKAQVHSGGRGKAGGVKFAKTPEEAKEIASKMLGMKLVTKQTGPEGRIVRQVLVTEPADVKKEYYLSITTSNETAGLVIVASAAGGTEIEETAKEHPEAIVQIPVSAVEGFKTYQGIRTAEVLGLEGDLQKQLISLLAKLTKAYVEKDCSLIEINPLVETADGQLLCLDAKVNFDDNALFRHPEVVAMRDINEEDPKEYKASLSDLNYVSLDGDIGCLVNGAGLAMATMDIIKNFGGNPANFLDVGGSATTERVKAAFEILLSDGNVKVIFVNIFGGIMKCDIIAQGLVQATREMGVSIPIVVRLEGTNVDLGRKIISESGLAIIAADDMADGARKAVAAAKGGRA